MCSGNPWEVMDMVTKMEASNPIFLFFIYLHPYNTNVRVVASIGGLCMRF